MADEAYTSRYSKQSKEKFRWAQVNVGDILSNALYDKARALRNARLLERSAFNYVCEDSGPPNFVSHARHWLVIWTDKVALLFSDYKSTTYTNNGNYRFPPRTMPLQKMAKLVLDNPGKYVHLIAAKSDTLDWSELEKDGKVKDTRSKYDKRDADFYNIPHAFSSRHRQHINTIMDLEEMHITVAVLLSAVVSSLAFMIHDCPIYIPFVWDTGTGVDVIQRSCLPPHLLQFMYQSPKPLKLKTANGLIEAVHQINLRIPGFPEIISPYVLDVTPNLLSVGRRVIHHGWSMEWKPYRTTMRPRPRDVQATLLPLRILYTLAAPCQTNFFFVQTMNALCKPVVLRPTHSAIGITTMIKCVQSSFRLLLHSVLRQTSKLSLRHNVKFQITTVSLI